MKCGNNNYYANIISQQITSYILSVNKFVVRRLSTLLTSFRARFIFPTSHANILCPLISYPLLAFSVLSVDVGFLLDTKYVIGFYR